MNLKPIDKKEAEMLRNLEATRKKREKEFKGLTQSPSDKMFTSFMEKNK